VSILEFPIPRFCGKYRATMRKKIHLFLTLGVLLVACSPLAVTPEPSLLNTPSAVPATASTPTLAPDPTDSPTPVFSSSPYNDGMAARRNGDYARAIAAFQLVQNSNPGPDLAQEAQYRLGEAYWLNNDDTRAINTLGAYLKANPSGAHALKHSISLQIRTERQRTMLMRSHSTKRIATNPQPWSAIPTPRLPM